MAFDWERHTEFFVALVALLLGIGHLFEIRAQKKRLAEQSKDIRRLGKISKDHDIILRALSTRRLGQFPDYMTPIAELIEKAEREIVILCDFPAYGSFSAPQEFLRYRHALEQKISEEKIVRVTCLDADGRKALTYEQFPEPKWEEWRSRQKKRLRAFLHFHGSEADADDLSIEQFAMLLEQEDVRVLDESLLHADKAFINAHLPLYFWLIDGKAAIFSIPSFTEKATEHGFFTLDEHLILGLLDLEARYRRAIQPI